MIECILTNDYEIYGNGSGSLEELVAGPTKKLIPILDAASVKMVFFVEAAELEIIEKAGCDPGIGGVMEQIRWLYADGHEIALHLHPQWYNAHFKEGAWVLDYNEYSLCELPEIRIREIVKRGSSWLRRVVGDSNYTPLSFRAGNWLLQPTATIAKILTETGIKVDSSVFKGGVQHGYRLDYRRALKNGYFWNFRDDVTRPDPAGSLLELPIYSKMVPFWKMITSKRTAFRQNSGGGGDPSPASAKWYKLLDRLRPLYPLKFDFCRMTYRELVSMVGKVIEEDRRHPEPYRPLVTIGHTKDLVDFRTIELFLSFLKERSIPVVRFQDVLKRNLLVNGLRTEAAD